jgi:hypothetical protein
VTDYVTGIVVRQNTQLTTATPEVDNILMVLPGNGVVSGTVYDEVGNYIPYAVVTSAGRGVRADVLGNYTLPNLPAGTQTISASDPNTGQTGNAIAPIFLGQTTSGINITILRPATLTGHVYLDSGGTIKPLDKAWVSTNGYDRVQTDAVGKYTIRNVAPNTPLTLRFVDTDRALGINMQVIFNAGETLARDVTLRSASLHGRVTQPDGVTGTIAQLSTSCPCPCSKRACCSVYWIRPTLSLRSRPPTATTRLADSIRESIASRLPMRFSRRPFQRAERWFRIPTSSATFHG